MSYNVAYPELGLFKISFPAEFHAQTACGAAVILHPMVDDRIDEIEKIVLTRH